MVHILFTDVNISFQTVWKIADMLSMFGCLTIKGDRIYIWSAAVYNSYYYQMNQLSIFKLMKTNNMLLNLSAVAVMFQEWKSCVSSQPTTPTLNPAWKSLVFMKVLSWFCKFSVAHDFLSAISCYWENAGRLICWLILSIVWKR